MAEQIVHELPAPPEAILHGGQEVLRAFIVEGDLHVSLTNAFERPAVWGVLLVDIARHVARMYSQDGAALRDQALDEIYRTLQAEWSIPDDDGQTDVIN
jgi:hypothetical protein